MKILKVILFAVITLFIIFLIYFFFLQNRKIDKPILFEQNCKKITEEQALNIVKELPEVKYFFNLEFPEGNKPVINVERKTKLGNSYDVRVFENVIDFPGATTTHTATMNWYTLDACTSKIKCSFSIYENGKFVRISEQSEYPCE